MLLDQPLLAETVPFLLKHFIEFDGFLPLSELALRNPLLIRRIVLVVTSFLELRLLFRYD